MTVTLSCSTVVDAPVERVFDLAQSFDTHLAQMRGAVPRTRPTDPFAQEAEQFTWGGRLWGIPWRMTVEIGDVKRPFWFVTRQVRGPFGSFTHEHRFYEQYGSTMMVDAVSFAAPFGVAGRWMESMGLRGYVRGLIERRVRLLKREAERWS